MLLINAIKQATQNKYKPVSKAISNSVIVEGEKSQLKHKVSHLIINMCQIQTNTKIYNFIKEVLTIMKNMIRSKPNESCKFIDTVFPLLLG